MRTTNAGLFAAAIALAAGTASAQPSPGGRQGPPGKRDKQQPLILQKEQLGTTAYGQVARARMRNGDCAGALDAFDAAIQHSIDPTLRRDRGLCHEQLGNPYPAIDDYRAYLTAEPDAPDAEDIRGRLGRLEQQTSGKSSQADDDDVPPASGGASGGSANGSASSGSGGGVSVSVGGADSGGGGAPKRDAMDYVEHDNDMLKSPLRRGKGWSLAPYFSEHKWFFENSSFGDSFTWAECIGLQVRYSFGHVAALFVEGAYQRFNSDSSAAAQIQGLTSQIGLELRVPLDADYDNQLLLAPGIGFDHIVLSSNVLGATSVSEGAIVPRARIGWRHLFDTSAGIDVSLDLGVGKFAQYSTGDFPFGGPSAETALVALNVGLVWGL